MEIRMVWMFENIVALHLPLRPARFVDDMQLVSTCCSCLCPCAFVHFVRLSERNYVSGIVTKIWKIHPVHVYTWQKNITGNYEQCITQYVFISFPEALNLLFYTDTHACMYTCMAYMYNAWKNKRRIMATDIFNKHVCVCAQFFICTSLISIRVFNISVYRLYYAMFLYSNVNVWNIIRLNIFGNSAIDHASIHICVGPFYNPKLPSNTIKYVYLFINSHTNSL